MRRVFLLAVGLVWLLNACSPHTIPTQATEALQPTPTCRLLPQPTGEKIIRPTIEVPPAAQIVAGQPISLTLSGGYVILNNAVMCGDKLLNYVHGDELPDFNWERTVEIRLDDRTLTIVKCGYRCQIKVNTPAGITPGAHKLALAIGWEVVTFEVKISGAIRPFLAIAAFSRLSPRRRACG